MEIEQTIDNLDDKFDLVHILCANWDNEDMSVATERWLNDVANRNIILDAIVNGYDVEEPLYRVKFMPNVSTSYLNVGISTSHLYLGSRYESDLLQKEFTEEEIKAINPLYWEFREEVKINE